MRYQTFSTSAPTSAETLFRWHTRRAAFERLSPPWAPVEIERFEGVKDGQRAELRLRLGPLRSRWVAEHHSYRENQQFADRQVEGPFASWDHFHRFEPDKQEGARLIEDVTYELPRYARLTEGRLEKELERLFAYRHRIVRHDLRLHETYNPDGRSLRIAISGASGLVGSHLGAFLRAGGHEVYPMRRSRPTGPDEIYWNHREGEIEREKLEGLDAVIHLAGESLFAPRWSKSKRKRIYESRARGTRLISQTLAELDAPPRVFISTSAVSYYDDHGSEVITEDTPSRGGGFLAAVCRAWEEAALPAREAGIRTVTARMGVVMSPSGGALRLMLPIFKSGLGGRVGQPDQYFPWIAIDDVLGAFYHVLMRENLHGPVNITAPRPLTMKKLTTTLGNTLQRPTLLVVPTPLMRTTLGEVANEVLKSMRVIPKQLEQSGFTFTYLDLQEALAHMLGRSGFS